MRTPSKFMSWSLGAAGLVLTLGLLAVLSSAPVFGPSMCTGPAVERCDYVSVAKAEAIARNRNPFDPAYGIDVFDLGSSVRVQQNHPYGGLIETTAVVIDERSCRVCAMESYYPPDTIGRGRLVSQTPPADPVAAEAMHREMKALGIQPWPDH